MAPGIDVASHHDVDISMVSVWHHDIDVGVVSVQLAHRGGQVGTDVGSDDRVRTGALNPGLNLPHFAQVFCPHPSEAPPPTNVCL